MAYERPHGGETEVVETVFQSIFSNIGWIAKTLVAEDLILVSFCGHLRPCFIWTMSNPVSGSGLRDLRKERWQVHAKHSIFVLCRLLLYLRWLWSTVREFAHIDLYTPSSLQLHIYSDNVHDTRIKVKWLSRVSLCSRSNFEYLDCRYLSLNYLIIRYYWRERFGIIILLVHRSVMIQSIITLSAVL